MSNKSKFQKGFRQKFTKVKTAKGRKLSSTKWLQRHLNDPFTLLAKEQHYRSRSAFKLLEINDKYKLIKNSKIIVDLGCAPGGWLQVCQMINSKANLIGIDLNLIDEMPNVEFIQGDFLSLEVKNTLVDMLHGNKIDIVISDISPPTCGHQNTDHLRLVHILEDILLFIENHLTEGGSFIGKMFLGSETEFIIKKYKEYFKIVKQHKPESSRKDSKEQYIVCLNFKKKKISESFV